jgi:alpha-ribazole phosphatase
VAESATTTVDLLRHGEPVGGRKYRGRIDDPLSERGWVQMWTAVGTEHPWDAIISSSLRRCAEFAQALSEQTGIGLQLEPRLVELGFGEWEGRTAAELKTSDPEILNRFWADPLNNRPPGAERLEAFRERVIGAWDGLLRRHRGRRLLIISHAGVMRMLIRHALDMPLDRLFRIQVPSAGLSRIAVDEHRDGPPFTRLVFHGR